MGNQEPCARIAPAYKETDGGDAARILKAGGLILDPWQMDVLCDWMGRDAAGQWAAPTCGGSVPRQNGKSLLVQGRASVGMILFNEQVIYTAHLQKTATETFEEMRDFFEHPRLKRYVADIKTALGREQIILKTGARIKFLARTRNGGRGQHCDLLIVDEAQEMDEDAQASFVPALSASLNPQTVYVGTPPDPRAIGTVFRKIRKKALDGDSKKTAWFEFSVDEIGDVQNRERWADANPALGRRILVSTIEGEVEQMDADTFARERLGWWAPEIQVSEEYAIPIDLWDSCATEAPPPAGKIAYGIKFAVDGSEVCLCGAVLAEDGTSRVELIDRKPVGMGVRWLSDWLNQRYNIASCVVIDGKNGVDVLVDKICDVWRMKGSVIRPRARDMIAATSTLTDAVNEHTLTWFKPQTALRDSAITSTKRPISGGWGFGGADSTPIEACSLALWGAKTCKRDPARKMRIG